MKGGYVENGELKADVRGWFDIEISGDINKQMGLDEKGTHSIGTVRHRNSKMHTSESHRTTQST